MTFIFWYLIVNFIFFNFFSRISCIFKNSYTGYVRKIARNTLGGDLEPPKRYKIVRTPLHSPKAPKKLEFSIFGRFSEPCTGVLNHPHFVLSFSN